MVITLGILPMVSLNVCVLGTEGGTELRGPLPRCNQADLENCTGKGIHLLDTIVAKLRAWSTAVRTRAATASLSSRVASSSRARLPITTKTILEN